MIRILFIALVVVLPLGGYQGIEMVKVHSLPEAQAPDLSGIPEEYREIIERAAAEKGVPVLVLAGIARAESDFTPAPAHKDPLDKGMFGLREVYHEERARLYGEYDPENPEEAARVAAGILADHYARFKDWHLAAGAYHQGAHGLIDNGPKWSYIDRVFS